MPAIQFSYYTGKMSNPIHAKELMHFNYYISPSFAFSLLTLAVFGSLSGEYEMINDNCVMLLSVIHINCRPIATAYCKICENLIAMTPMFAHFSDSIYTDQTFKHEIRSNRMPSMFNLVIEYSI